MFAFVGSRVEDPRWMVDGRTRHGLTVFRCSLCFLSYRMDYYYNYSYNNYYNIYIIIINTI